MSLFSFAFLVLVGIFFLCAVIDEEEDSSNKDSRIQIEELMISGRIFAGVASA